MMAGDFVALPIPRLLAGVEKLIDKYFMLPVCENIIVSLTKFSALIPEMAKQNLIDDLSNELEDLEGLMEGGLVLVSRCSWIHESNIDNEVKYAEKMLEFKDSLETQLRFFTARVSTRGIQDQSSSHGIKANFCDELELPQLPALTVGLDVPVKELKAELLKDDVSILVVTAPGGYGKTTLAIKFCHDQQVKDKFKNNIIFVTVCEHSNLKLITEELYKKKGFKWPYFSRGENPVKWLQRVQEEKGDDPLLLVLDDVRLESEYLLEIFEFQMSNYKILVTSRSEIPFIRKGSKFQSFGSSYQMQRLNDSSAMELFQHTASLGVKSTYVPKDLLKEILKYCGGIPLAITVVGKLLCGQSIEIWRSKVTEWSKGYSKYDFETEWLLPLQSSLDVLDNEMPMVKKFFLDLGAFPENAEIQVMDLIDMWTKLYDIHLETKCFATLNELGNRSLANLFKKCDEQYRGKGLEVMGEDRDYSEYFVRQHNVLRALAIKHSEREPIQHRERLILEIYGGNLPDWWREENHQVMKARLLFITIGRRSFSRWLNRSNVQFPETEILILNFQKDDFLSVFELPNFVEKMDKLKMLVVQRSIRKGYVHKFELLGGLSNLTNLTLDGTQFYSFRNEISLKNLHKLHLRNCDRIHHSRLSREFPNLKEIVIDSCKSLFHLPDEICELIHLTKLIITGCHELFELPKAIGQLVNLEVLRLRHIDRLRLLPDSIGNLHNLKFLEISACQSIIELPGSIGELKCLRNLSIQHCEYLYVLPEAIGNLINLEVLSLRWCQKLSGFPYSFRNLKKLTFLDIHACIKIEKLPERISELKSLRKLQTTGCNKLKNLLQSVSKLGNLKELVCDDKEATEYFRVSRQNGDGIKTKNQFSAGLELANLLVTSDPVHEAWAAIEKQQKINPNAELSLYNEIQKSNPTIIAFGTPRGSLLGNKGLISSLTLREEGFPHFEFLCNRCNSLFSLNEAALNVFRSNYEELNFLKNELVQMGSRTSSIIITGSSIGGCVAILFTLWLLHSFNLSKSRLPLCITFGSPLPGDELLRQCVSEFTAWKSCFLHVASNQDPTPKLFLSQNPIGAYYPFGTFLLCSASGCASLEEPDFILEWLMEATSKSSQSQDPDLGQQFFNYGSLLEDLKVLGLCRDDMGFAKGEINPLQASIITQLQAIGVPLTQKEPHSETNSAIKRMEKYEQLLSQKRNVSNYYKKLSDMKICMASLEWHKKEAKRKKVGLYDMYKKLLNTSDMDVYEDKFKLMSYWEDSVAEQERKPHDFFWNSWLMAGTSYRRMVEPLQVAEYYMKDGAKNYITDGRPRHFILLEKWWDEREKPEASQNNAWIKRQVAIARLNEDSCFWAHVEEAIISCNLLRDHKELNTQDRESSKKKLEEFEGYVIDAINNNEVSLDIFLEGSSFRQWWTKYEAIMGSFHCSELMRKLWKGMGARSSPSS